MDVSSIPVLTNDSTMSFELAGELIVMVALILYHYFYIKNNMNTNSASFKLLKENIIHLTDNIITDLHNKLELLENKELNALNDVNGKILNANNNHSNLVVKVDKLYDNVSSSSDKLGTVLFKRIDDINNDLSSFTNTLSGIKHDVELLKSTRNDITNIINKFQELTNNEVTRELTNLKKDVHKLQDKIYDIMRDIK